MRVLEDFSLSNFSTIGIGGKSRYFTKVKNEDDMRRAFDFSNKKKIPFFVLGKGSNIVFDDKGFFGLIIKNEIDFLRIDKNRVEVGSGFSLQKLSRMVSKKNLSGLEFAGGIPATVGGAVYMNASSNNMEISSYLEEIRFLTIDGKIEIFKKKDLFFGYRYCSIKKKRGAIISLVFLFKNSFKVEKRLNKFLEKKKKMQPIYEKSAGCVFKNPKNNIAAKLIEGCGLKGKIIGDAKISNVHANFIVNSNNASSKDVLDLISLIVEEVKKKYEVELEKEIIYVPYV
ncbi:MAG: hypothetical protein AMS24_00860 [Chlamydiae bacterium SM23_39]|nr:MAG: hypothetical protein AMS24_00860 [Chlamydiae bacterium SM23_39]